MSLQQQADGTLWADLYQRAAYIEETTPWQFFGELDIFCIPDDETGLATYFQVFGKYGPDHALVILQEDESLYVMMEMMVGDGEEDEKEEEFFERVIDAAHLRLSFDTPGQMGKEDRKTLRRQGLDSAGRGSRPVIRRYGHTLCPGVLVDEELAEFLYRMLGKALELFEGVRNGTACVPPPNDGRNTIPTVTGYDSSGAVKWKHRKLKELQEDVPTSCEPAALTRLERLKHGEADIDLMLMRLPEPVSADNGPPWTPYFPRVLLAIDLDTDEMLPPVMLGHPLAEDFSAQVQNAFAEMAEKHLGALPSGMTIWPVSLGHALEPLLEKTGIDDVDYGPEAIPDAWCARTGMKPSMTFFDYGFVKTWEDNLMMTFEGFDDDLDDDASEPLLFDPHFGKTEKIGRNDPCPCGSGKKYKKCCGN